MPPLHRRGLFSAAAAVVLWKCSPAASSAVEMFVSAKEPRERLVRKADLAWVPAADARAGGDGGGDSVEVTVRTTTGLKQTLEGFGGAITDSAASVYSTLSAKDREAVMEALFGDSGNRLTLMRVPIGPSDFATSVYSYDETSDGSQDLNLTHFSVAHDDAYIVPMIKDAMASAAGRTDWAQSAAAAGKLSSAAAKPAAVAAAPVGGEDKARSVRVLATPWTAPSWMKRGGLLRNSLKPGLVQDGAVQAAYAAYVSRFVDAYAARGIPVWAVTVQNEPHVAGQVLFTYPCNGFEGSEEGAFLGAFLGPQLRAAHPGLKIFVHDDQKEMQPGDDFMVDRVNDILAAADAAAADAKQGGGASVGGASVSGGSEFVDGAAFHWYGNNLQNYDALEKVHAQHPELTLLATEATLKYPSLRKWEQAVKYAIDIAGDLNHWAAGWIEWNVLLDGRGGPTCIGPGVDTERTPESATACEWEPLHNASFGACDAPIRAIGTAHGGGLDKERLHLGDQYYMLGHFSRFMPPDSTVLNTSSVVVAAAAVTTTTTTTATAGQATTAEPAASATAATWGKAVVPDNNPEGFTTTAAVTPSGDVVVVCLNQRPTAADVRLQIPDDEAYAGLVLPFSLPANSIATLVLPAPTGGR